MNRIAVIGCVAAGKTTLSLALAEKLALRIVHLDQLRFGPGWVSVGTAELQRREQETLPPDGRWIADGNNGATMMPRLHAADTVIFLDLPTRTCVARWLWRRVRYVGRVPPGLPTGCKEWLVDRRSAGVLRYMLAFRRKHRARILERLQQLGDSHRVITLRTPRAVEAFLAAV